MLAATIHALTEALPATLRLTGPGARALTAAEAARCLAFGLLAARWLDSASDPRGWRPAGLPGWPELVAHAPEAAVVALARVPLVGADPLTALHTHWLATADPLRRHRMGTWYTPPSLAEAVVEHVASVLPLAQPRVLDPAVGTGEFLLAAGARWPGASLAGVDVDPVAVVVATARLARAGRLATLTLADALVDPPLAPVDVIVGNPPWLRASAADGGLVVAGHPAVDGGRPLFEAVAAGVPGRQLKNAYNHYVYFWRLCLWLAFERSADPAAVALVTPSSWVRGPGFGGLRALMRRLAEGLDVVALGGDGRAGGVIGPLGVRTPTCAAVAWRRTGGGPATVRLAESLSSFKQMAWSIGAAEGALVGAETPPWPTLEAVFPWIRSGVKAGRTWPVAPDEATLHRRWRALMAASGEARRALFKDSPTGRRVDALLVLPPETPCPPIRPLAWRTGDQRMILLDDRLLDRGAEALWAAHSPVQRYLTTGSGGVPTVGPAASIALEVPDLHHFSGRGARDVIPLWCDAAATQPNVAADVVARLAAAHGQMPTASALFDYATAVLCQPGFGARLGAGADQVRLPITLDRALFEAGAALGAQLARPPVGGRAGCVTPITVPERPQWTAGVLTVGDGRLEGVAAEVWAFEVAGHAVVRRFIRSRLGGGRRSSPLDDRAPWTPATTTGLLAACWWVEALLARAPALADWLARVGRGPCLPP